MDTIFRKLGLRFCVAGGILATVAFCLSGFHPSDLLVRTWVAQMPAMPDRELLPCLRRIGGMGLRHQSVLIESLASERTAESTAARIAINEQIAAWRLLPLSDSSRRVHQLAHDLELHFDQLSEKNREFALTTAKRILEWPVADGAEHTMELLQLCERILRSRTDLTHRGNIVWRGPKLIPADNDVSAPNDLPFGAGSVSDLEMPLVPHVPETSETNLDPLDGTLLQGSSDDRMNAPSRLPAELAAVGQEEMPTMDSQDPSQEISNDETISREQPTVRRLFDHLRSENLAEAAEAIRELRKLRFTDRDVELALRLTDPDPKVRRSLGQYLQELVDIDPAPWLLWLSEDRSVEVRRTAIAIMATSSDPRLQTRLRSLEFEDTDDEIIRIARMARSRSVP